LEILSWFVTTQFRVRQHESQRGESRKARKLHGLSIRRRTIHYTHEIAPSRRSIELPRRMIFGTSAVNLLESKTERSSVAIA
jgi:hypothetical protein